MGVVTEVFFWSAVFLGTAALLFCSVYALILFTDLTVDHINPIDLCELINRLVVPEYAGHVALALILLVRGFVLAALLNIPLLLFHGWRYKEKKHMLDNTSIFNDVEKERRVSQWKLVYHLLMFFVYLYYFILALVSE